MICPKCGQNRAHRSHRSLQDWAVSWLSLKPYRCRDCSHRFYAYREGAESSKLRTPEEQRVIQFRRKIRWHRLRAELMLYGLSSLIFIAILYYILQQQVSGG
jgi:hypothetical protein